MAYSCFCYLMKRLLPNFPHGAGMDENFGHMRSLLQILDSELYEHIHRTGDFTHFYFCYRWFLLDFKRGSSSLNVKRIDLCLCFARIRLRGHLSRVGNHCGCSTNRFETLRSIHCIGDDEIVSRNHLRQSHGFYRYYSILQWFVSFGLLLVRIRDPLSCRNGWTTWCSRDFTHRTWIDSWITKINW